MTNRRIRPWRRTAEALQALLILGIPFVRIGGESALRFDIPTLRLHIFGTSLWMDEFFMVLIAIIFFTFLIVFITVLFGGSGADGSVPRPYLMTSPGLWIGQAQKVLCRR